ncbi:MAG: hypothetical protein WCK49_00860 [Myxococcaceae bacterium]
MSNVVMPILSGFVLPIALTALTSRGNIPAASIPAEVIPVGPENSPSLAAGTKILISFIASSLTAKEPITVGSNTGLAVGSQFGVRILDATPIVPLSTAAMVGYSGLAAIFGIFANPLTVSIANRVSSSGLSVTDIGGGTTASGLSKKDIIDIALAVAGILAFAWDNIEHALCSYESQ